MNTIKPGQPSGLHSFFLSPFPPDDLPVPPPGPGPDLVSCPSCYCGFACDCGGSGLSFPFSVPSGSPIPVESRDGAGAGGVSSKAAPSFSVFRAFDGSYFLMVGCPTCAGWGRVPEGAYYSAPFDRPCSTCTVRPYLSGRVPIAYIPPGSPLIPPPPVPFDDLGGFDDEIPY